MPWHDHFPATRWLLTSRIALRAYLSLALILITLFAGWHLRAWNDQRRIRAVLDGLERLSLELPSPEELQRFLEQHGFALQEEGGPGEPASGQFPDCARESCRYELYLDRWPPAQWAYDEGGGLFGSARLAKVLRHMGVRFWWFSAHVSTRGPDVTGLGYDTWVEDAHPYMPLQVSAYMADRVWLGRDSARNVSPEYMTEVTRKYPDTTLRVAFTPLASPEKKRRAFDVQLRCMSAVLRDCSIPEFMPSAWRDHVELEAATKRLRESDEPCPASVVRARVRDAAAVVLAELIRPVQAERGMWHRGDYKVVEVLKGKLRDSVQGILHDVSRVQLGPASDKAGINSILLRRGDRMYFFTDWPGHVDRDCEAMQATPEVIAEVEKAIAEFRPKD